ncbi:methylated-DNA--[protein]-cysteine S-methyltransferase [Aliiglaciecola lipolytica]|uniref:Methylated-DNA--protein-cysteine methyltransferase n=1 Tax=Aliiglaciecola lipolytica E3 TaxID=1127673 RepID=K6YZ84_9ALTE|nr:methylated-DNA--[protein]-cysteine S-methyltransferase [Aliiglaciecola lipolytica]GAC16520.1 methylated-DNA-[protein]-cysteine S-methyltransferase [Aliiglaciecola lipolytica E3]
MNNQSEIYFEYLTTPIGQLEICANESAITSIYFSNVQQQYAQTSELTHEAAAQLTAYFNGNLTEFQLPLGSAGTEFQQQVWQALCHIPFGSTCSYADIANQLQNPKAVRAVGAANGKNPISIVVPCHRVIGKNGTLTGYAGGLDRKSWLLALEQKVNGTISKR